MDIETQMLEKKLFLPIVGNVKLIKNAGGPKRPTLPTMTHNNPQ